MPLRISLNNTLCLMNMLVLVWLLQKPLCGYYRSGFNYMMGIDKLCYTYGHSWTEFGWCVSGLTTVYTGILLHICTDINECSYEIMLTKYENNKMHI